MDIYVRAKKLDANQTLQDDVWPSYSNTTTLPHISYFNIVNNIMNSKYENVKITRMKVMSSLYIPVLTC